MNEGDILQVGFYDIIDPQLTVPPTPNSARIKAGYMEGGGDTGFGVSKNLLTFHISEKEAARLGSLDGGKRIELHGTTLTGSLIPSIEFFGVTTGYLNLSGIKNGEIQNAILYAQRNISTYSVSAGEVLNGKMTIVETPLGKTKISGRLYGISLGLSLFPVDGDAPIGNLNSSYEIKGGIGTTTQDTLDYIDRNEDRHERLDSIKTEIENRNND